MIFNIFISSRNKNKLILDGVTTAITMTDIRQYIKKEIENIKFLGNDFFRVEINEAFAANATEDSYKSCITKVKMADLFIALYTGESGWAPAGYDLGICHAELDAALTISSRKSVFIKLQGYFTSTPADADEVKRNAMFSQYVLDGDFFLNDIYPTGTSEIQFKEALLKAVKDLIYAQLKDRIELSRIYFDIAGNNKISLNWKKLKYSEREQQCRTLLSDLLAVSPDFKIFTWKVTAIPDNISVPDAKAYTGRPFLNDQNLIDKPAAGVTPKYGPFHFIAVYGKATVIQVKNVIGYPDVSAIQDEFGIYVWEQNTHIQLVFLTECSTPAGLQSKLLLFNKWCRANGEYENMKKRAQGRHMIMTAINEAQAVVGI